MPIVPFRNLPRRLMIIAEITIANKDKVRKKYINSSNIHDVPSFENPKWKHFSSVKRPSNVDWRSLRAGQEARARKGKHGWE